MLLLLLLIMMIMSEVGHVAQRAEAYQGHPDEQVAQHRANDDEQQRQCHDAQLRLVVVD